MIKRIFHSMFLVLGIFASGGIQTTLAQNSKPIDHPGTFVYFNSKLKFSVSPSLTYALKVASKRTKIKPLVLKKATTLSSVLFDAPVVNPLKGFNVMPDVHPVQYNGFLGVNIKYLLFPFYKDKKSGKITQLERWGVDIEIAVNNPAILFNSYFNRAISRRFENNHSEMGAYGRYDGEPPFYFKKEMRRDANGFWVVKGIKTINAARIIGKKGIPLLIPVTQERYIKFIIGMEQLYIKKANKAMAHYKISLKYAEKDGNKSRINEYNKILKNNRIYISNLKKAINGNQAELKGMSDKQLKAAAYVNFYKDSYSIHPYNVLTPHSDKDGEELVMVNPAYFDKAIPKSTPQLIIVTCHYSSRSASPEVISKLKSWFNGIAYKKLQGMLKE